MDNLLITPVQLADYRNISKKYDKKRLEECISLAQKVDLQEMIGEFYFDVMVDSEEAEYADLMSGATFTVNDKQYFQEGLKSLIADLAYIRYLYIINTNQTAFGMVQKLNEDSQPIDRNMIKDLVKVAQQDANTKFRMIDKYLIENSATFKRYCAGYCSDGYDVDGNTSNNNRRNFNSSFSQNFWVKK